MSHCTSPHRRPTATLPPPPVPPSPPAADPPPGVAPPPPAALPLPFRPRAPPPTTPPGLHPTPPPPYRYRSVLAHRRPPRRRPPPPRPPLAASPPLPSLAPCAQTRYRGKMVVIFAGYSGQMSELLDKVNPGLKSRVSDVIDFPDFSPAAAAELAALQLDAKRLQLPAAGAPALEPWATRRLAFPAPPPRLPRRLPRVRPLTPSLPVFTGAPSLESWTRRLAAAPGWANGRDVETFVRRVAVECATRQTPVVGEEVLDTALATPTPHATYATCHLCRMPHATYAACHLCHIPLSRCPCTLHMTHAHAHVQVLDAALATVLAMKRGGPSAAASRPPPPPASPFMTADSFALPPPSFELLKEVTLATRDGDDEPDDGAADETDETDDSEVAEALEAALEALGFDETDAARRQLARQLSAALDGTAPFPSDLRERVAQQTGAAPDAVDAALGRVAVRVLQAVREAAAYSEEKREALEELDEGGRERALDKEARIMEALRTMGPCPQGFSWHRSGNGWRCAGGSHFVYDDDPILNLD